MNDNTNTQIEFLLRKFHAGQELVTLDELELLYRWSETCSNVPDRWKADAELLRFMSEGRKWHSGQERFRQTYFAANCRQHPTAKLRRYSIAASLALLIGIGTFLTLPPKIQVGKARHHYCNEECSPRDIEASLINAIVTE